MKRHWLAFGILILLTACSGSPTLPDAVLLPPTQPAVIDLPVSVSPQLTRFHFIDENAGWGVTESQVVRTADGGLTWMDVSPLVPASFGYAPGHFFDARTAWMLLAADDYTTGTLYRTQDGGSNWNSSAVPFAYASFQFLDPNNGFALASLGAGAGSQAVALYRTSDAGQNWMRLFTDDPTDSASSASLPLGGQKYGFAFLDDSHGWVGGSMPVDGYIFLYETRDGGVTWRETDLSLPAGYELAQTGNSGPQFFSATEGILIVNLVLPSAPGLATLAYRTSDGGETWTSGQVIPSGRPADFHTFSNGVAWGGGQFYVTRDAGQTWGAVVPNQDFSASLGSLQFASPLTGWVLTINEASDPSLYRTTDGGATWALIIP